MMGKNMPQLRLLGIWVSNLRRNNLCNTKVSGRPQRGDPWVWILLIIIASVTH